MRNSRKALSRQAWIVRDATEDRFFAQEQLVAGDESEAGKPVEARHYVKRGIQDG